MAKGPDKVSGADTARVLSPDGVREKHTQICEAAREEFWNRLHQLVDVRNPDGPSIIRILDSLHKKHADDREADFTPRQHGKPIRSAVAFKTTHE